MVNGPGEFLPTLGDLSQQTDLFSVRTRKEAFLSPQKGAWIERMLSYSALTHLRKGELKTYLQYGKFFKKQKNKKTFIILFILVGSHYIDQAGL